ncbi:MAG: hypothetical protein ABIH41_00020 [Nanoarchaeota archaeon]
MPSMLIKGISLYGRMASMVDKYEDPPPGASDYDTERAYRGIHLFLELHGSPVLGERVRHLPHIDDGFITASVAASLFQVDGFIVANQYIPHFYGCNSVVQAAGPLDREQAMDSLFERIKEEAGWQWMRFWAPYGERKTAEVALPIGGMPALIPTGNHARDLR